MQNSARCVLPVTSVEVPNAVDARGRSRHPNLPERDLQFVQRVVPRLVHARMLTRRAGEEDRKV
jgi:hypothetical protein